MITINEYLDGLIVIIGSTIEISITMSIYLFVLEILPFSDEKKGCESYKGFFIKMAQSCHIWKRKKLNLLDLDHKILDANKI
jgi:hypothetical protein